jgi:hypothetical protein
MSARVRPRPVLASTTISRDSEANNSNGTMPGTRRLRWVGQHQEFSSSGIDGSVEIDPDFFDLDRGLIHSLGVVAGFQVRSRASFKFGSICLDPAVDGAMIDF